jgi:hypothetical protein
VKIGTRGLTIDLRLLLFILIFKVQYPPPLIYQKLRRLAAVLCLSELARVIAAQKIAKEEQTRIIMIANSLQVSQRLCLPILTYRALLAIIITLMLYNPFSNRQPRDTVFSKLLNSWFQFRFHQVEIIHGA